MPPALSSTQRELFRLGWHLAGARATESDLAVTARRCTTGPMADRTAAAWAFVQGCRNPSLQRAATATLAAWCEGDGEALAAAERVIWWCSLEAASSPFSAAPELLGALQRSLRDGRRAAQDLDPADAGARPGRVAMAAYALARASVGVRPLLPELFEQLALKGLPSSAAAFALHLALSRGEDFRAAADAAVVALDLDEVAARAYGALLRDGFVPPPAHRPHLLRLVPAPATGPAAPGGSAREVIRCALASMVSAEDPLPELVEPTRKALHARTAAAVSAGLAAVETMADLGLDVAPFLPDLERLLTHKVREVRYAVNRLLAALHASRPDLRDRLRAAAESAGHAQLASLLAAAPHAPPALPGPACPPPIGGPARAGATGIADPAAVAVRLRGADAPARRSALDLVNAAAAADPATMTALLPAIVDALGTPERHLAVSALTRAVAAGIPMQRFVPVVAGLLVDGDWVDSLTMTEVVRFLRTALDAGLDIRPAWPWLFLWLPDDRHLELLTLRAGLVSAGIERGLPGEPVTSWLLRVLEDDERSPHPRIALDQDRVRHQAATALAALARRTGNA